MSDLTNDSLTPKAGVEKQQTWVPVYVERAICDLIPDMGYAREIARQAWAWDDEHPGAENALYRWQNEAIRQRRDLIALEEFHAEAAPSPVASEGVLPVELPLPDDRKWTPEQVEAATKRICVGGHEAGEGFFARHPDLGFRIAVYTQCELDAELTAHNETKRRLEKAEKELSYYKGNTAGGHV